MKINRYFLLKVWLISFLMIVQICLFAPFIGLCSDDPEFHALQASGHGLGGVLVAALKFSVPLFICLCLIYFGLLAGRRLPPAFIKIVQIFICVVWLLVFNRIGNSGFGIQPFYIAYLALIALAFLFFDVYQDQWLYWA